MNSDVDLGGILRPVRTGNAFEETVERLLTVIKLGLVARGDRFPAERELASLLGISRLTLREAIRELSQAGYVESRRGRFGGTFCVYTPPAPSVTEVARVAMRDGDRLADALIFRYAVETGAADLLAQRFTEAGLPGQARGGEACPGPACPAETAPRAVLLRRLADVSGATPADYRRLDTLFHLSIAELTGSRLLAEAAADARLRLNDLLNAIPVLKPNIAHAASQHVAIVDAILAGDAEAARRAVAEHLAGTGALLRGFLG
ncbi:MAG: FCD domain-containing protein [Actinomycetota bacterium]|nr:FCD domain-containing protein [Actinomycetota bacterium]